MKISFIQKNNGQKGFTPTPVLVWFRKVRQMFVGSIIFYKKKYTSDIKARRNFVKPKLVSGFTLLEMLVAVTLFTIITTMSIGSLITVFDANRKTQTLRTVMENLNFTMEGISREIKFGTKYYCSSFDTIEEIDTLEELDIARTPNGGNCDGERAMAFKSQTGNLIRYRFTEVSGVGKIDQSTTIAGVVGDFTSITAPEIDVDKLKFFVIGSSPTDIFQPRATISMNGHTGIVGANSNTDSSFSLQTTVSQRDLDKP